MNICPDCKQKNPLYSEFCQSCGATLQTLASSHRRPRVSLQPRSENADATPLIAEEVVTLKYDIRTVQEQIAQQQRGLAAALSVLIPGLGQISRGHLSGLVWVIGWLVAMPLYIRSCINAMAEVISTSSVYRFTTNPPSLLEGLTSWHWVIGIAFLVIWLGNIIYCASQE